MMLFFIMTYVVVGGAITIKSAGTVEPMIELIRIELTKHDRENYLPIFSFLMFMCVFSSWPFAAMSYLLGSILMSAKEK